MDYISSIFLTHHYHFFSQLSQSCEKYWKNFSIQKLSYDNSCAQNNSLVFLWLINDLPN